LPAPPGPPNGHPSLRVIGQDGANHRQQLVHPKGAVKTSSDPSGQVILDPDEEVQQAIRLAFDLFEELGTANAVVKHFKQRQLLFPTAVRTTVRE